MIAYLDCSTGVSGDKLLGALVDAGFDLTSLTDALAAMGLADVRVAPDARVSAGLAGVGITVEEPRAPRRNWRELDALLETTPLPEQVRDGARHALALLAGAEAEVHGVEPQDVHFHEIGAVDSIVDIVSSAFAVHRLGIGSVRASRINVGTGIDCTIRELASTIAAVVGYRGAFAFDTTKPDGTPRKCTDTTRLDALGYRSRIDLAHGIADTYRWFVDHYGQARGI